MRKTTTSKTRSPESFVATSRSGSSRRRSALPGYPNKVRSRARDHHHPARDHGDIEDRGVDMNRHALDEGPGEEGSGQRDRADQERKGEHLRGDDAGEPKHRNLDQAGDHRDDGVGRDHGGAFEARRHQQRQQDHARARRCRRRQRRSRPSPTAKSGIADPDVVTPEQAAQRHAQDQHRADHQRRAGIGQPRIAVSAERGRKGRRHDHDQRAAAVGMAEIGDRAADIGEYGRDRDDRHHRFGADQRHQYQRHQRAGAVAGEPADHGSKQRHAGNQQKLRKRDVGKARKNAQGMLTACDRGLTAPRPDRRWRRAWCGRAGNRRRARRLRRAQAPGRARGLRLFRAR